MSSIGGGGVGGVQEVIQLPLKKIEQGLAYITNYSALLTANNAYGILLRTGTAAKFTFNAYLFIKTADPTYGAEFTMEIDPGISVTGQELIPTNMNFNFTTSPDHNIYLNPTITGPGTTVIPSNSTTSPYPENGIYFTSGSHMICSNGAGFVSKPSTDHYIELTARGGSAEIGIIIFGYEDYL